VHIEGVAAGPILGPCGPGQGLPTDDRPEALDQRGGERMLYRREIDPAGSEPQEPVAVDLRSSSVTFGSGNERGHPRSELALVNGHPHPVLEAVTRVRRLALGLDEEKAGRAGGPQAGEAILFLRPPNHHYVHGGEPKEGTFQCCFAAMNRLCPMASGIRQVTRQTLVERAPQPVENN